MKVRAKRLGWNEHLTDAQTWDMDPYDYEDDNLEGELETLEVDQTEAMERDEHGNVFIMPALKLYLVGGQEADPNTIEEIHQSV